MPLPRLPSLVLTVCLVMPITVGAQTASPVMPWGGDKPADPKPAAQAEPADRFGVAVSVFVTDPAQGYGMYQVRPNNRFKAGETLRFYLEPVGYGYKQTGALFTFGATADLRLTQTGNTVFSKDGFLNADFLSHHRNKEINFTGSLDVSGAPAGQYNLELVLKDKSSDAVAKVVMPFVIE